MDAKVGDYVVTPRRGKPVEIQALWYNALCTMSDLATRFGDEDSALITGELAKLTAKNFNRKFWNEDTGCLEDVLGDPTVRPNQIFAVSLRHSMLSPERARRVVDVVQRDLWTPAGLRSLAPSDPQYRPRYEGDVWSRDTAYHQGTVWPWLMGPFLTAYVKVHGPGARVQAAEWLNGFASQMQSACIGQISEIADAEAPFTPRGCVAQAWSVAELLRAAVEDVFVEESLQRSA
jgi:glycogen debranching enzyme